MTLFSGYKSNTDVLLVYSISFNFNKNAKTKYTAKGIPKVTKDKYINNRRIFLTLIPNRSEKRVETSKPCLSK